MSIVIATLVLLAVASSPPCEAWATNQPAREGLILGKVAKANTASSLGLGLNVKSLATTIDCGDNFTLAVTVQDAQLKHARTNRYSSRLHMQVSDGAYFVESSIPGPPPLDTSGDNFTSTFLWTLPKGAKSTYEYRITFLSDICPPPAQINVVATLERLDAKAAWTKHPQSGNVTHETTVSVRGGVQGTINYFRHRSCSQIGCMECFDGSDDCVRCIDDGNWQLVGGGDAGSVGGKCVCAVGAGTYAASPAPPGFLGGATMASCDAREFNPILNGPLALQQCNSANPRVMAETYLDPVGCTCQRCPDGWTSLGGNPGITPCFDPLLAQQLVGLDLLVQPSSGAVIFPLAPARHLQLDDPAGLGLMLATGALDAFANVFANHSAGLSSALAPVGDMSRAGEVLYGGSVGVLGDSHLYRANLTFSAPSIVRDALIAAINAVNPGPTYCADFFAYTGWDVCEALEEEAPQLSLVQLQAYEAAVPPLGNPFSAIISVAGFISKIFVNSGKAYDQKVQKKFGGEAVALIFDSVLQVFGFASFFTQEDKYLPYFKEINQTTHEILDRVIDLQKSIRDVQRTLSDIQFTLSKIQCQIALNQVEALQQQIERLWYRYAGPESTSVLNIARRRVTAANTTTAEELQLISVWVQDVIFGSGTGVAYSLQRLHVLLLGDNPSNEGVLEVCGTSAFVEWFRNVNASNVRSPLDDRQYYGMVQALVLKYVILQSQGAQMLREAYMWRAQKLVRDKDSTNLPVALMTEGLCDWTYLVPDNDPVAEARAACSDWVINARMIYDNMVIQIAYAGLPLSDGDAGQGVRLLLGSDLLRFDPQPKSTFQPTRTTWLFPANVAEFDPRCTSKSVAEADRAGCALVGTFRSCGAGCNLDSQRERRWLDLTLPSGYPLSNWTISTYDQWAELRGMLTAINPTGVYDDGDTLALLEKGDAFSGSLGFAHMTDRPYWIVNATTTVNMKSVAMGLDALPSKKNGFIKTYVKYAILWVPNRHVEPSDVNDRIGDFDFRPDNFQMPNAQCFATYNPQSKKEGAGRASGTSGVFCSDSDFAALYNITCDRPTSDVYLCKFPKSCSSQLLSSLYGRFGPDLLSAESAAGKTVSACAWDPWHIDDGSYERQNAYGGSCMLTSGIPNTIYDPGACNNYHEDPGLITRGYSGYPNADGSIEKMRPTTFGCQGFWNDEKYARDLWFRGMGPECFVGFGYPWFPNVRATGAGGQDITKYWRGNSTDSSGRPYFRLPALNISNRVCADLSEFTNASLVYKPTKVLPWMLPQKIHIPIRCGDDLARGIVKMIGSGQYEARAGKSTAALQGTNGGVSTATLHLAANINTVTCSVDWASNLRHINMTSILVTVRDGPIFSSDKVLVANAQGAPWQFRTFDLLAPSRVYPTVSWNETWMYKPFLFGNWTGSFLQTCTSIQLLGQDEAGLSGGDAIQAICSNSARGSEITTCQARCCPSRHLDNIDGYLRCAADPRPSSCSCPEAFGWQVDTTAIGTQRFSTVVSVVPGFPIGTTSLNTTKVGAYAVPSCYSTCCPEKTVSVKSSGIECATANGSRVCGIGPGLYPQPCPALPPSVSLDTALDASARNWTRTVACTVLGQDPSTLMPISVEAQSKVVLAKGQGWTNFTWPMAG